MSKIVYKRQAIKDELTERFNNENVGFEDEYKYGNYIDDSFDTVFDCFIETIKAITGSEVE